MELALPLDQMTVDEKFRAIEMIWADLEQNGGVLPVPQWHLEVLAAREILAQSGQNPTLDWEEAKRSLLEPPR